jgi:hypothetical protein
MLAFLTEKSRTSCSFLQQSWTVQVDNLALKSGPLKRRNGRKIDAVELT